MVAEVVPFRTLLKEKDIVAGGRALADGDCVIRVTARLAGQSVG
jgi:hypothetical protein